MESLKEASRERRIKKKQISTVSQMITFAKYKRSEEFFPCISTRMKNVQLMSQKRIERGIVEFLSREINGRYLMLKAHTIKKHRVNALELVFQTDCKAFIALSKYELGATRALNSSPGPLVFLWSIVSPPPPSSPYHSTTLAAFRQFYSLGPGLKTEPFDAEISGFFVPFYASSR